MNAKTSGKPKQGKPRLEERIQGDYSSGRGKLALRLREARKACGLRQNLVAFMTATSQSYISRVERTGDIEFVILERLAAVYSKPVTDFLTRSYGTVTARRPSEPDVPMYMGKTRDEWKYYLKHKRWPSILGYQKPGLPSGNPASTPWRPGGKGRGPDQ
jgi:transcriptional regulator with XRE-family HTH domain